MISANLVLTWGFMQLVRPDINANMRDVVENIIKLTAVKMVSIGMPLPKLVLVPTKELILLARPDINVKKKNVAENITKSMAALPVTIGILITRLVLAQTKEIYRLARQDMIVIMNLVPASIIKQEDVVRDMSFREVFAFVPTNVVYPLVRPEVYANKKVVQENIASPHAKDTKITK